MPNLKRAVSKSSIGAIRMNETQVAGAKPTSRNMIEIGNSFVSAQKMRLKWSIIFPVCNFLIQIGIILNAISHLPPPGPPREELIRPPTLLQLITPALLLLAISLFAFLQYYQWVKLNHQFLHFKSQESQFTQLIKSSPITDENGAISENNGAISEDNGVNIELERPAGSFITLSQIFYSNRSRMELIRIFFMFILALGIFSILYFGQLVAFDLRLIPPGPIPIPPPFLHALDYLVQIGLILYLFTQWRMIHSWNRRFSEYGALEQKIHDEVFKEMS